MLYGSNGKGREIRPTHLFPVVQIDPLPGLMAQEGISGNKAGQTSAPLQHAWQLLVFVHLSLKQIAYLGHESAHKNGVLVHISTSF